MQRTGLRHGWGLVGGLVVAARRALPAPGASAQTDKPQYGGSLNIGTNSPTLASTPESIRELYTDNPDKARKLLAGL